MFSTIFVIFKNHKNIKLRNNMMFRNLEISEIYIDAKWLLLVSASLETLELRCTLSRKLLGVREVS